MLAAPPAEYAQLSSRSTTVRSEGKKGERVLLTRLIVEVFNAKDVAACMATVPFNSTVASQLLQYLRDFASFQSTTSYVRDPPPSYQQPAFDLFGSLDLIQQAVNGGAYQSEYDFEISILQTLQYFHDSHLDLIMGVSGVFGFGSSYAISSISEDGIQPPKPYFRSES